MSRKLFDLMRSFSKNRLLLGAALGAGLTAGLVTWHYAYNVEPLQLEVSRLSLPLARLGRAFEGYRLVQISDLHVDERMSRARLEDIVARVNAERPDLVVITGDFVTRHPERYAGLLAAALGGLESHDGVLAVLGNHDHWAGAEGVRRILEQAGIHELENRVHTLERGPDRLHMAGVDDVMNDADRLDRVLAQVPEDGAAILLAHEPDFARSSSASGRFDLQLSGHSHGGQVWLPLVGPPFLPAMTQRYPRGLYRVGDMWLYTNRGLGVVHLPVRFNSRPEITVLTLKTIPGDDRQT